MKKPSRAKKPSNAKPSASSRAKPNADNGEIIRDGDEWISICCNKYTLALEAVNTLKERIQSKDISRLPIQDITLFRHSLELLGRNAFFDFANAESMSNLCKETSQEWQDEYKRKRFEYVDGVYRLAAAIEESNPKNQRAKRLSAAIRRLTDEVSAAMERGYDLYLYRDSPVAMDYLLTDERHGTLWDAVDDAIVSLSADADASTDGSVKEKIENLKDTQDLHADCIAKLMQADATPDLEEDKRAQVREAKTLFAKRNRKGRRKCAADILAKPAWANRGYNAFDKDGEPLYSDPIDALRNMIK